ncbi:MAG TPA: hypothetical protein VF046_12120 [Gemmatimonadales bacterium]
MSARTGHRRGIAIEHAAVILALLAGLLCTRPARLQGQRLELRPMSGLQSPSRFSLRGDGPHVRQKFSVFVGARLAVFWNSRLDVVNELRYIPGTAVLRGTAQGIALGTTAHLLSLTTRVRYWLLPPTRRLAWEVHSGVGAAFGGTQKYGDLFEHTMVGGVVGTVLRYQVLPRVCVQVQLQDYLRSYRPLRISFGIGLPMAAAP